MLFKAVRLACVLLVVGWATGAAAQTKVKYSLSGNGGFWIGGGMPIPVTKGAPPNQAMVATPNATVQQTQTVDPHQMTLCPSKMVGGVGWTGTAFAGQWGNNPNLFMVSTHLTLKFPANPSVAVLANSGAGADTPNQPAPVVFRAGGRTGPSVFTWCPSQPHTNPPTCTISGGATVSGQFVAGQLTYTKTANQFGGPGQGSLHGRATVWARVASPPPCKHPIFGGPNPGCIAVKGFASPAGYSKTQSERNLGAIGGPFHYSYHTTPKSAVPNVYYVSAPFPTGTIVAKVGVAQTAFKNSAAGFGGPWTTGRLTVRAPAAGAPEVFTLSGYDNRAPTGIGPISLVAGGVSNRAASGPNANRGWLNLVVGPVLPDAVPSLSGWSIASLGLALLGIGAAGLALARRRK
jgi:hypothetical protein